MRAAEVLIVLITLGGAGVGVRAGVRALARAWRRRGPWHVETKINGNDTEIWVCKGKLAHAESEERVLEGVVRNGLSPDEFSTQMAEVRAEAREKAMVRNAADRRGARWTQGVPPS